MRVRELMRVHVITARPDATLGEAVDMFDLYQLTSLPVVDANGKLLGVVLESDIAREVLSTPLSASAPPGPDRPLMELLRAPCVSVEEEDSVSLAAERMMAGDLARIPVTLAGRVTGSISRIDICQSILEGELPD